MTACELWYWCLAVVGCAVAGAANLDVIQEVEYVKEEDKLAYLLDCLQKTAPPVLIFAENKRDVDSIHEFLLVQVRQQRPGSCHRRTVFRV
jgi:hypothetical protein